MKKYFLAFLSVLLLVIMACDKPIITTNKIKEVLKDEFNIDLEMKITESIELPSSVIIENKIIRLTYESDKPEILSNNGILVLPNETTIVTILVINSFNSLTFELTFIIVVDDLPTIEYITSYLKTNFNIYDNMSTYTDLILPNSILHNDENIFLNYESSDVKYFSNTGVVTTPLVDTNIQLTISTDKTVDIIINITILTNITSSMIENMIKSIFTLPIREDVDLPSSINIGNYKIELFYLSTNQSVFSNQGEYLFPLNDEIVEFIITYTHTPILSETLTINLQVMGFINNIEDTIIERYEINQKDLYPLLIINEKTIVINWFLDDELLEDCKLPNENISAILSVEYSFDSYTSSKLELGEITITKQITIQQIIDKIFQLTIIPDIVRENLYLPTTLTIDEKQYNFSWVSSHQNVINTIGEVIRPTEDTVVSLSIRINLNNQGNTVYLVKTVTVRPVSDLDIIDELFEFINLPSSTYQNIALIKIFDDVTCTWTSSHPSIINSNGIVAVVLSSVFVTLNLAAKYNGNTYYKTYMVEVIPQPTEVSLVKVLDSIRIPRTIIGPLPLFTEYKYGVSAVWESSLPDIVNSNGEVNLSNQIHNVTLTVTLTLNNQSMSREFNSETLIKQVFMGNNHIFLERANQIDLSSSPNLEFVNGRVSLKANQTEGMYESEVFETSNFTRLVGSFSCTLVAGATAELEVRVRQNGVWSMYFTYGRFGMEKNNRCPTGQQDTVARLATDELLPSSSSGANAFQYKITLRRSTTNIVSPGLSLVANTLSLINYGGFSVDISNCPDYVLYDVPVLIQTDVPSIGSIICSATSSAMLLKYKGENYSHIDTLEHRHIAEIVRDWNYGYGNWSYNAMGMGAYGYDAYIMTTTGWNEIMYHLATVGPVGASVRGNILETGGASYNTNGHLIVIRGYRIENGQTYVIVNDPYMTSGTTGGAFKGRGFCEFTLATFNNIQSPSKVVYVIE